MNEMLNLKRFRQTYKLTQAEAAASIGIDQRQWNRYENGKNEIPVRYLKAICQTHNVSADWILGITGGEMKMRKQIIETEEAISIVNQYWNELGETISDRAREIIIERIEMASYDIEEE